MALKVELHHSLHGQDDNDEVWYRVGVEVTLAVHMVA